MSKRDNKHIRVRAKADERICASESKRQEEGGVESLQDLFERLQKTAAERPAPALKPESSEQQTHRSPLLPDRHPVGDFFIADITDWVLKSDRHSMEHPMFGLSKKPDHTVRHYEHNGIHITVKPGADGVATIWDIG